MNALTMKDFIRTLAYMPNEDHQLFMVVAEEMDDTVLQKTMTALTILRADLARVCVAKRKGDKSNDS